jgi:hypothetical protein
MPPLQPPPAPSLVLPTDSPHPMPITSPYRMYQTSIRQPITVTSTATFAAVASIMFRWGKCQDHCYAAA